MCGVTWRFPCVVVACLANHPAMENRAVSSLLGCSSTGSLLSSSLPRSFYSLHLVCQSSASLRSESESSSPASSWHMLSFLDRAGFHHISLVKGFLVLPLTSAFAPLPYGRADVDQPTRSLGSFLYTCTSAARCSLHPSRANPFSLSPPWALVEAFWHAGPGPGSLAFLVLDWASIIKMSLAFR